MSRKTQCMNNILCISQLSTVEIITITPTKRPIQNPTLNPKRHDTTKHKFRFTTNADIQNTDKIKRTKQTINSEHTS